MNSLRYFLIASATVAIIGCVGSLPQSRSDDKDEGWIQLFNGKDLTGWKMFNPPSGNFKDLKEVKNDDGKVTAFVGVTKKDGKEITLWQVKDGMIVGGGPASHLFTDIEAENFRYRVEAKINDKGNSGQYFRTKFGPDFPAGYEAQINATHGDPVKTGSLYPDGKTKLGKYRDKICVLNTAPHKPDEFFTQEVIAVGPKITIIVNGKTTLDNWEDPDKTYTKGHFALQGHDPGSVMTFKKVEYKPIKE
jgi:hypothetical protein